MRLVFEQQLLRGTCRELFDSFVAGAGDEEVQYVYVTLPKDADVAQFGPGAVVSFRVSTADY